MNAIIPHVLQFDLMPANPGKDVKSRIGKFTAWATENGGSLLAPDLSSYRNHLLETGLRPSSVSAHLSTIRGRYAKLANDPGTRDTLYEMAAGQTDNILERKAVVDETITRLKLAIDPQNSEVKQATVQDREDSSHLRLTKEQAETLLKAPGVDTLKGKRDTAIIALMLCTGVREAELCALVVNDLRQTLGGALALLVRHGKGDKQRLIPYGQLEWALVVVDAWLKAAGITSGPVFRGLYKGGSLRPDAMTPRALHYMLRKYPIAINGDKRRVAPHDLRRTYAKRLYVAGTDLLAIQQNLGHADHKTTERYIGAVDASRRQPPAIYDFDLRSLE